MRAPRCSSPFSTGGRFFLCVSINLVDPLTSEEPMPKGIPKTEGEKIGDKFDKAYSKMRREKKSERAAKSEAKKGECDCGKK